MVRNALMFFNSDRYKIFTSLPSSVFIKRSREKFNELSCSKFMKKIATTLDLREYSSRSLEELKQELIFIRDLKVEKLFNFNKAILSTKDRIFPFENMQNYWSKHQVEIVEMEKAHYIFDSYENWSDLV